MWSFSLDGLKRPPFRAAAYSDSPASLRPFWAARSKYSPTHDVVVGPTQDGGYYLVGAKAAHPLLFGGDGMGAGNALDRLLTRTKVLELSTGSTEPFYDIDVANDLILLARELRLSPTKAPRTAA